MAEEIVASAEGGKEFSQKLPESLDHMGIRFKSPELSNHLNIIRGRESYTYYDLLPVISAEKEDIKNQKKGYQQTNSEKKTNKLFGPQETNLKEVEDGMQKIQNGELSSFTDEADRKKGEKIMSYLDNRIAWAKEHQTDEIQKDTQTDEEIFTILKEKLVNRFPSIEASKKDRVIENTKEEIKTEHEELPEARFKPGERLQGFFKEVENEQVTIETVYKFVTAEQADLVTQKEAFETQHAPLFAAVDKAQEFLLDLPDPANERENGKKIIVIEKDGKIIEAGWEDDIKNKEGKIYRFDPRKFSDETTLGDYVQQQTAFENKIEGTERQEGIKTGLQRLSELVANSRTKMTKQELLPIFTAITEYANFLEEGYKELMKPFDGVAKDDLRELIIKDTEAIAQYNKLEHEAEILEKLAEQVKKREKSNKPRFFTRVKN